ncbi:MAG: N-acetyltransferase [Desulfomonile tiedjei]|uniref:N-acetyltransferase n=1 Tax=Desulfomonile tiedjei TaxID=2358 RepID=A0A9D6UZ09_9BACT|nr:N-acetyltransferase [Desulfomonile tiedjei]
MERFLTSFSESEGGWHSDGRTLVLATPRGEVTVRTKCPPGSFGNLRMEDGLGHFAHYSSIIKTVGAFEEIASRKQSIVTMALAESNLIAGYCVCWYPAADERWSALGELMYEMAAIEVSRNYRGADLAGIMLGNTLQYDFFEDKIAYMVGFSWHWDLEGTGLNPAQYRQKMMRLYGRFGFREVYTNEPNIALRVENVMMIRVGSRVSAEDQLRFRHLRFGIKRP